MDKREPDLLGRVFPGPHVFGQERGFCAIERRLFPVKRVCADIKGTMMRKESMAAIRPPFSLSGMQVFVLFLLRVGIGWHFLYEGLIKVFDREWSAAGYLRESRWLLADFFHWIVAQPTVLKIVDLCNAWGLTLIGLALLLGILPRLAAVFGMLLLVLYYLANPALPGYTNGLSSEGHYLLVNKNIIELLALGIILFFPESARWGLLSRFRQHRTAGNRVSPASADGSLSLDPVFSPPGDRRQLLKRLAILPFFGAFVYSFWQRHGWESYEEGHLMEALHGGLSGLSGATIKTARTVCLQDLKEPVPAGQIGSVRISRLICGGNVISGEAHSRDLIYVSSMLRQYFTDEKIMETLRLCEACGINTVVLRTAPPEIRILKKYWKQGGKIQWLAVVYPKPEDVTTSIQTALDNGAMGAFIQGAFADRFVQDDRLDIFEKAIAQIKRGGVIAGSAAHELAVPMALEAAGIEVDFYMKTLHRGDYWSFQTETPPLNVIDNRRDNYWSIDPEKTIAFMKNVKKPWIAFKILAAGAIQPEVGMRYAFENGADFACVGMFDFQVIDDANCAAKILAETQARPRPWFA